MPLENTADANVQVGKYGSALQAAAASYRDSGVDVVCLLLERGADVNAQGEELGGALQAALSNPNDAIVKLLLKHGADSLSADAGSGTA
jgi:ankyrin repeat protein